MEPAPHNYNNRKEFNVTIPNLSNQLYFSLFSRIYTTLEYADSLRGETV